MSKFLQVIFVQSATNSRHFSNTLCSSVVQYFLLEKDTRYINVFLRSVTLRLQVNKTQSVGY